MDENLTSAEAVREPSDVVLEELAEGALEELDAEVEELHRIAAENDKAGH